MPEHAEIFTDETAAAYVGGVTARAIREWRASRGLPFIRVTGKVIRIRRSDLDQWLDQRRFAITKGPRVARGHARAVPARQSRRTPPLVPLDRLCGRKRPEDKELKL
jgi:excisionase family DNA binding protein